MANAEAIHVVVDGGVDDALALAVLIGAGVPIAQIVATEGSRPLAQTAATTARLVSALDAPIPVRLGATSALSGRYPDGRDPFHGEDCFGGRCDLLPDVGVPSDGCQALEGSVFVTGALTVVAAAVAAGEAVGEIIWMGGSVACGGNMTPAAEFNAWMDPVACDQLFREGRVTRMVPLDVTSLFAWDGNDLRRLRAGSAAGALVGAAAEALYHRDGVFVPHDAVAAAAVLSPDLFHWVSRSVRCETKGLFTRGETVVDRRHQSAGGDTLVADGADVPAVNSLIFNAVTADL